LELTYDDKGYKADINLFEYDLMVLDFGNNSGATAEVQKNKIILKNPDTNAQVIITIKDNDILLEANEKVGMDSLYGGVYHYSYYENKTAAILGNLVSEGIVPQYVQDRGHFYVNDNYYRKLLKITGDNVRLRSQPNTEARIIASVNKGEVLQLDYEGEWTNPQEERWILAGYYDENLHADIGEFVWVYGKYAEPITQGQ
jgi:hypothetical protein